MRDGADGGGESASWAPHLSTCRQRWPTLFILKLDPAPFHTGYQLRPAAGGLRKLETEARCAETGREEQP